MFFVYSAVPISNPVRFNTLFDNHIFLLLPAVIAKRHKQNLIIYMYIALFIQYYTCTRIGHESVLIIVRPNKGANPTVFLSESVA